MARKSVADFLTVFFSRGAGYILLASLLLVRKFQLISVDLADVGQDLSLAMVIVSPLFGSITSILSRRVVQTHSLATDINLLRLWVLFGGACTALGVIIAVPDIPSLDQPGRILIAAGFISMNGLVGALLLWLGICGDRRRFILLLAWILSVIPISIIIRLILKSGGLDKSFALESCLIFVGLAAVLFQRQPASTQAPKELYPFSLTTMLKYGAISVFVNGAIAIDWHFGKTIFTQAVYTDWASIRVTMERFLLPLTNAVSMVVLIRILRNMAKRAEDGDPNHMSIADPGQRYRVFTPLILIAVTAVVVSVATVNRDAHPQLAETALLFWGYLLFGVCSLLLDIYQAKFGLVKVILVLAGIMALRSAGVWEASVFGGPFGYALTWAITNVALLWYLLSTSVENPKEAPLRSKLQESV